ncbi:hypothetical protein EG348_04890 [Chryseobacterium sp. G0201]|nr:hypothetical protein EG348_04890 [Chryseobacterium sp. G0201]
MKRHPFEWRPERSAGRHSKDTAESRIKLLKSFEWEREWVGESGSGRIGGFGSALLRQAQHSLASLLAMIICGNKKAEFNYSAFLYYI